MICDGRWLNFGCLSLPRLGVLYDTEVSRVDTLSKWRHADYPFWSQSRGPQWLRSFPGLATLVHLSCGDAPDRTFRHF